ncbi:EamA family transporter [Mucilaginibacter sp. HD30]
MEKKKVSSLLLIFAFAAIYVVWGTTYLANRYALQGFPSFLLSAFRYLSAGLILGVWAICTKQGWPDKRELWPMAVSGILMLVGGSGLVVLAEQYVDSGYAAVLMATEPLLFILLDRKRWALYFTGKLIISGIVLGFCGIMMFTHFAPSASATNGHQLLGTLLVLLSALLWVTGALYGDRHLRAGGSTFNRALVQLLAAGLVSVMIAAGTGELAGFHPGNISVPAYLGLLYLVVMGSLIAYLAYAWLLSVQPPAIVSTHTYVNPVIAIFAGWLLASEKIAGLQLLALVIVLAGVLLTQLGKKQLAKS